MTIAAGTRLGRYEIRSQIGAGGMGEIYLAIDTKLDRKVALKILPPEFAEDTDRMSRFVREAKSASALNHPNIITIHEIGESDGTHFIATEFIDGKTLNEYAKANPLDYTAALEIAIQVVSALGEAHQAGIVHRDIKPDNVMVRANGLAKILDFGIAKLSTPTESSEEAATSIQAQTQAGMIIGTPRFMSPEQARGRDVDHQTDIFSFGVMFYEMLSGNSPFAGETVSDVLAAVLTKEPRSLSDLPAGLEEIVNKTLQKDKKQRYQTTKDLLCDLREVKEELEFRDKLKRTADPGGEELETQILEAPMTAGKVSTQNSIAVLPLKNMSADEDNEYFCDGLAEELLNALSKIDDLKVAARTSAFSFKGKNANIGEIGEKLGVKTLLEGSVRRSGNRLRISVQLVNALDGFQLWSERYDRELRDIFDVQDEITLAVVDALKLKLFGDEKAAVLKRYTEDAEVHELFLKGRYYSYKYTAEGWKRAIEFFEKAIEKQPDHAPAHAGMAASRGCLWFFGLLPAGQTIPQSRTAAIRALEIDENLAEAYLSLAIITFFYDWEWEKAEQEFKRSIALNPNNAEALSYYAIFLGFEERFDEAISRGKRALELDPLSPLINMNVGWTYFSAGLLDEALTQAGKMLEIEPDFYGAYWLKGAIYLSGGEFEAAVEDLKKAVSLGGHQIVLADLGSAYSLAGKQDEAANILDQLLEMRRREYVPAICLARLYSRTGENKEAIEWLKKAFEERNGEMVFLKGEIAGAADGDSFNRLGSDPALIDLLRKMNLP
jgi:eukaryotic-like serine/threonine-protein kinase